MRYVAKQPKPGGGITSAQKNRSTCQIKKICQRHDSVVENVKNRQVCVPQEVDQCLVGNAYSTDLLFLHLMNDHTFEVKWIGNLSPLRLLYTLTDVRTPYRMEMEREAIQGAPEVTLPRSPGCSKKLQQLEPTCKRVNT